MRVMFCATVRVCYPMGKFLTIAKGLQPYSTSYSDVREYAVGNSMVVDCSNLIQGL